MDDTPIRKLWSMKPLRLVTLKGTVSQVAAWEKEIEVAAWRCTGCNTRWTFKVDTEFITTPGCIDECKEGTVVLENDKCQYKKNQWGKLQESADDVEPGKVPMNAPFKLSEGLVGNVKPGDRVELTGWVQVKRRKNRDPSPVADPYLHICHVKQCDPSESKIVLTEEDKKKFHEWVGTPDHLDRLVKSTASTLHGMVNEKTAVNLFEVGGTPKTINGERIRGDIHVFLPGDPGEGKSKLLKWAILMSTRGILTNGRGSTAAGLTASVIKDEETGLYSLAAGAMVLADMGHCGIDELDKMRPEDRSALHSAMEDQIVRIDKANIHSDLNSRTAMIAACNPKDGIWNTSYTLRENLKGIPVPLLTRFDLIFVVVNERNVEEEMVRADYIINSRTDPESVKPPYLPEELKKFYSYARQFSPTIPPEAGAVIRKFYEDVLRASKRIRVLQITPRDLEGLFRLTEACAKLHLRDKASVYDAETAIRVKRASMMSAGMDPSTGRVDMGILETGVSTSSVDARNDLLGWIMDRERMSIDNTVVRSDVIGHMVNESKIGPRERCEELLRSMIRDGVLYEPKVGRVKAVG